MSVGHAGLLSCDKVPLLAPTGSVITLFPTATTVPSNGSMEIVATVIEQGNAPSTHDADRHRRHRTTPTRRHDHDSIAGAGTPVQNGTVVYLYDDDRAD